ncbi:RNA polymerase sigma factor [Longitalea arenae]|uniref:RNA polymerase sigma factor n=1 Tax=Longitalea arenae TaxID=2812558 RepID=UPI0019681F77|nr:RNA polymerase sigma-70 factor [Longitalea arenae]
MEHHFLHNDKELLRQIAEGDQDAFARLYIAFYDKVYSVALMYLKVHELAEDSAQQVFLQLWEKRSSLLAVNDLNAFIFITARNQIFNSLRKSARHETHRQLITERFLQETGSPEDLLILKQRAGIVQEVIGRLPERQQQAFRLSRESGLRHKEIAVIMKVSVTTVKEHISNALQHIRTALSVRKDELLLLLVYLLANMPD